MLIGFWSTSEVPYGAFSNWAKYSFIMDGIKFSSSEQAFMYLKAKLFGDEENMKKILESKSPMIVKRLGRAVKPFDSYVFDKYKFDFMVKVNYEKFTQNENLKKLLLSTGDATIVEASPKDGIWGIKMDVNDPDFNNPEKWRGLNLLGKALMVVRDKIKEEEASKQV